MRFMMLMIPNVYKNAEPDFRPDADAVMEMMKFNEALANSGSLIGLDGLHPPITGARVTFRAGKATITDGPFTESKEHLGGYWIINVPSRQDAIDWAAKCPAQDGDVIEVRQIFECEEFPQDVQDAVRSIELGMG
ncbi:MAG: hypothetical protein AMXMBFR84_31680 [Candidatus Hydrogenedentota bacterium]